MDILWRTAIKTTFLPFLKETYIQKSRLRRIIERLGGKPTDAKADLSLSFMGNNFPKTVKSKTEDNSLENSMPEEDE